MKRLFAWLLCLGLLLGLLGCGAKNDSAAVTGPLETAGTEAPEAEAPTKATEPAPTETEPPAEPTTEPPTGDRTGIVNTDYSNYTPGGLPKAKYTRLQSGFIGSLEPGNYGQIFPFAGEKLLSAEYDYSIGTLYGFVDANGQIICDPVYSSVTHLRYYDESTGELIELPMWSLSYYADPYITYQDEEYTWWDAQRYVAVAALDGSWVTRAKFSGVTATPKGFIGWYPGEPRSFDVFDLHANRLFGSKELGSLIADMDYYSIQWDDGVYLLSDGSWDDPTCFVLDENGKLLFRINGDLFGFSDGLCLVRTGDECYGYIDKTGNWVIEPIYTSADNFHDGVAFCFNGHDSSTAILIDKAGNELLRIPNCDYLPYYYGGGYYEVNANGKYSVYDAEGHQVEIAGASGSYWRHIDGSVFFQSNDDSASLLMDFATGETLTLSKETYLYTPMTADSLEGPTYHLALPCYQGVPCYLAYSYNSEHTAYQFIGKDFTVLGKENDNSVEYRYDQLNDTTYLTIGDWDSGRWELLRPDGSSVGSFGNTFRVFDGWVQDTDVYAARLYNPDGELVFCYPLLLSLDD